MSCPRCGSTSREMIGPTLVRCANVLYDRVTVPPPIGRPFDMIYQDVAFNCGYEYYEGSTPTGQDGCPEHGLFSTGMCNGCHSTAVCGRCGRWKCRVCRSRDEAAEAEVRLARLAKEEAAQQAKKVAHESAVRANTAEQAKSQQQYVAELRNLDREIAAMRHKLHKRVTEVRVSYVLSALIGLGFWFVALIILVKTPVKPVSIFPFGIGLPFLLPLISSAKGAAAKSKEANLATYRVSLLQALGCGKDCEYGCRKY